MKRYAAAFLLALVSCGEPEAHEHEEHEEHHDEEAEAENGELRIDRSLLRDLRLTTAPVEERAGGESVTALGEAQVSEDHYGEVGTPITARIARVIGAPGQRVVAGDPLVELDAAPVGEARASMSAARARVELAERTLARRTELGPEGIVPAREREEAEAELQSARAELAALRSSTASLGAGQGRGARFVLVAPTDGVVLERDAVLGSIVDPEHVLFRVADLTRLWVVVHVFERDAVRLREGATARIRFAALPGQSFEGNVEWIGRSVDSVSRTVPARISIANDGTLRPGMSASATLPLGSEGDQLLAVPSRALQRLDDGWVVFIPRGEGVFDIRRVGRGRDLEDEVEVLRGLAPGDRVVVDGAFLLKAEAERARGGGEEHHHH